MEKYDKLVKALRCKGLSKECDSCGYGYHLSPDSECNDACHFEQIAEDAAAAIEALDRLLDQNTQRCEALRKQLREAHESYERHLNELEAQLPKRGKWVVKGANRIDCSVCGHSICFAFGLIEGSLTGYNYCPNCGAKMEVQDEA